MPNTAAAIDYRREEQPYGMSVEERKVVALYEQWRAGAPRPTGFVADDRDYPFAFLRGSSGSGYAVPDLDALGDQFSSSLLHYYSVPDAGRPVGLKRLRMVRPAFLRDLSNRSMGIQTGILEGGQS